MILLSDNDIVCELARCDLIEEFLAWLEVPPNELWVLPTLRFAIGKRLKAEPVALSALNFLLSRASAIPLASTAALDVFDGLDVGERAMFAVFLDMGDRAHLITGDKRALVAVADIAAIRTDVAGAIANQVHCLESTLLSLIARFGFDVINGKVAAGTTKNVALRVAFGTQRGRDASYEALRGYLVELRARCPFVLDVI